jgi:hypothetical protein
VAVQETTTPILRTGLERLIFDTNLPYAARTRPNHLKNSKNIPSSNRGDSMESDTVLPRLSLACSRLGRQHEAVLSKAQYRQSPNHYQTLRHPKQSSQIVQCSDASEPSHRPSSAARCATLSLRATLLNGRRRWHQLSNLSFIHDIATGSAAVGLSPPTCNLEGEKGKQNDAFVCFWLGCRRFGVSLPFHVPQNRDREL